MHPLAKPLVDYKHHNKAGIRSCNFPLIHWQSWKKVCIQYSPCSPQRLPSLLEKLMEVTCDFFFSPELPEIFQKLTVHAKVFKEHHTVSLFSKEQTCPWPYSPAKKLLKRKLGTIVPALLRWQYFEKAAKAHFYLSNATAQ